jgi:deoxyribodipyrimidine photolyase-related protein
MNFIIFPHQLYDIKLDKDYKIYIVEEPRYFTDFKFHKLKLAYHRTTMKKYYDNLKKSYNIKYINFDQVNNKFYKELKEITIYDPYDNILLDKLNKIIKVNILENIQFLLNNKEIHEIQKELFPNKKYRHDVFYKYMRIKHDILINNKKPVGDKWSFDSENRIKLPKNIDVPDIPKIKKNKYIIEAIKYINTNFKNNYGELENFIYPIDHKSSLLWLNNFLEERLSNFGKYEDAVSTDYDFIFHSVLSPMMNIGLLQDKTVVDISYAFYLKNKKKIQISSFEGFIRQIIGWRQYVYFLYILEGDKMRKTNLLDHHNKLNDKWWNNIEMPPIDFLIEKIKKYAYVHHIERLMFLSNWLLLNQTHPNEVYRIFMEWTIDAYDWAMVPNVYGMGQSASDIMMTRLYFSSSNYILKMSNFKKDNWTIIWDAVYYNFIDKHKKLLSSNYATAMQVKHYTKKSIKDKEEIKKISHDYIKKLNK